MKENKWQILNKNDHKLKNKTNNNKCTQVKNNDIVNRILRNLQKRFICFRKTVLTVIQFLCKKSRNLLKTIFAEIDNIEFLLVLIFEFASHVLVSSFGYFSKISLNCLHWIKAKDFLKI
jgi:hypothetical protein